MRKGLGLLVLGLLVILGWWLWTRSERRDSTTTEVASTQAGASPSGRRAAPGTASPAPDAMPARARRRPSPEQKARRDAMHAKILDAMQAKARTEEPSVEGSGSGAAEVPRSRPAAPELPDTDGEQPAGTGGMTDRTGTHGYLMKAINEEFMPLADECITMAHERQPELSGMLIMSLEIISDEDIGGVVDTIAPGPDNEVPDPDLLECIEESILSVTLPPPPQGGRDPIALSMPLTPPEP